MTTTTITRNCPRRSCACARWRPILTEKGYVDPAALDAIIEAYETKIGPHNGARVVAKAWTDPAFKQALLRRRHARRSARSAMSAAVGDHLVAVENTPAPHNMVVCTLCSCYPWEVLGLPPVWYKSAPYRSRAVKDPRGVLADFGVTLPEDTEIRVWDSTAETRFLVLPMRPAGTEGWSEEQLADLVTRDSMIGTGLPLKPGEDQRDERRPRHGRHGRLRQGRARAERAGRSTPNGKAACWRCSAPWAMPAPGNIDMSRFAQREAAARRSIWPVLLPALAAGAGEAAGRARATSTPTRLAAGHALRPAQAAAARQVHAATTSGACMTRGPFDRPAQAPAPVQAVGDRVRTKNIHPPTHTRLPRYVRGQVGVVELVHGCHVFPDTSRHRPGRQPAVALHGGVRRPRAVGAGRRPDAEGVDRRLRALSGAGVR